MAVANPLEAHHILHSRGAGPVEVLLLVSVNNFMMLMFATTVIPVSPPGIAFIPGVERSLLTVIPWIRLIFLDALASLRPIVEIK